MKINRIIFEKSPKTFMEILKAHKREVQFANALAFFFRPKEKHGLKTLFIDALLNTNCTELKTDDSKSNNNLVKFNGANCNNPNEELAYKIDDVKVKAEDPTDNKKRIDILIETDTFVICIEFKINHVLNNPLENYRNFFSKEAKGKRIYFIVLTPNKKEAKGDAKIFINSNSEFKQVILSHFFKKIEELLPDYNNEIEEYDRYYSYFNDFLQTVKNREIQYERHKVLQSLNLEINITTKCEFNPKGFLEIKKKNHSIKLRIITQLDKIETKYMPGWQIEKWEKNKKIEILKNLDSQSTFEEIIKEIKFQLTS